MSYYKVYSCSFALVSSPFQLETLCLLFVPVAQQGSQEPLTMALKEHFEEALGKSPPSLHTQWDTCIETGTNFLSSSSSLWNCTLLFQSLWVLTWNSIIHWKLVFPYFENLPCRLVLSDKCLLVIFRQTLGTSEIEQTVSLFVALLERKCTHHNMTGWTGALAVQPAGFKVTWIHLLVL